jgi:hypothetical protein
MIHSVSTLEDPDRRFNSLKPRLLKCTTLAVENMGTSQEKLLAAGGANSTSAGEREPWCGYKS